jgi:hypothetical protein
MGRRPVEPELFAEASGRRHLVQASQFHRVVYPKKFVMILKDGGIIGSSDLFSSFGCSRQERERLAPLPSPGYFRTPPKQYSFSFSHHGYVDSALGN